MHGMGILLARMGAVALAVLAGSTIGLEFLPKLEEGNMTRHQKSTFVLTSRVTPVKWWGPPSGFIDPAPPRCVTRKEFAHSTVRLSS